MSRGWVSRPGGVVEVEVPGGRAGAGLRQRQPDAAVALSAGGGLQRQRHLHRGRDGSPRRRKPHEHCRQRQDDEGAGDLDEHGAAQDADRDRGGVLGRLGHGHGGPLPRRRGRHPATGRRTTGPAAQPRLHPVPAQRGRDQDHDHDHDGQLGQHHPAVGGPHQGRRRAHRPVPHRGVAGVHPLPVGTEHPGVTGPQRHFPVELDGRLCRRGGQPGAVGGGGADQHRVGRGRLRRSDVEGEPSRQQDADQEDCAAEPPHPRAADPLLLRTSTCPRAARGPGTVTGLQWPRGGRWVNAR